MSCPDASAQPRLERGSPSYPEELLDLGSDAPGGMWARGHLEVLTIRPRVAIVGTRRATAYGRRVTTAIATSLARAGACVVSGLAAGIDGHAHRAALDAGGATIAVLGTGLDVCFPRAHAELQQRIGTVGLLLSELDPAEPGMPWTFPKRNRIIAALSDLVIVVEAGERSGALITAAHALEIGRGVAGVPGPIDQPQSTGVNRLLRDGAVLLSSVEDALALVGLAPALRTPRGDPDGADGKIWAALARGPLDMDTLCTEAGLPAAQCMAAVTRLEIGGSVECALTGEVRRR